MLIGIISDTHGHLRNTQSAIRLLADHAIECVIHCGDIGSPEIPWLLRSWPTHYVLGNVDHDEAELRQAIVEAGHICHGRFGQLELTDRRVAFLHGDDRRRLTSTVAEGAFDLVCYGHTHRADLSHLGRTWMLNPGAVFRAQPHSVAVIELETLEVQWLEF